MVSSGEYEDLPVFRKRSLGQDRIEDLELQTAEILQQRPSRLHRSRAATLPDSDLHHHHQQTPLAADNEDSRSLSSFEACENENLEDGNNRDLVDHVPPTPVSSFPPLDCAVSSKPPRSPFVETLLLPAFMHPTPGVDRTYTFSTEPIQGRADTGSRSETGWEWSGEWNTDNIQEVIQKLRVLK